MRGILLRSIGAFVLLVGGIAQAAIVTIDFEELPDQSGVECGPVCTSVPAIWNTQGFSLQANGGTLSTDPALFAGGIVNLAANPSDRSLIYCAECGQIDITFAQDNGQAFGLDSLDFSGYSPLAFPNPVGVINIFGFVAGGGIVQTQLDASANMNTLATVTFDSSWSNLNSVAFNHPGSGGFASSYQLDNIVVNTVVPIPAAAWMFGSALGLLGWMRRSQKV